MVSLFGGGFSYLGSDRRFPSAVIADTEIISQLHGGGSAGQSEQAGNKINCISVRLASEAMETQTEVDGKLVTEVTSVTKNGKETTEPTFDVVKTVEETTPETPSTGDNAQLMLWIALAVVAMAAAAAALVLRKKAVQK